VLRALTNRLSTDGELLLHSSEHRSQLRNRGAACERLVELVARALVVRKRRKKTRPSRGAVERRLKAKRTVSDKKKKRGKVDDE
jgi:ribosome-associated protein